MGASGYCFCATVNCGRGSGLISWSLILYASVLHMMCFVFCCVSSFVCCRVRLACDIESKLVWFRPSKAATMIHQIHPFKVQKHQQKFLSIDIIIFLPSLFLHVEQSLLSPSSINPSRLEQQYMSGNYFLSKKATASCHEIKVHPERENPKRI